VSALCRALGKPGLEAAFRDLPGAVIVEEGKQGRSDIKGTWVHLSAVLEKSDVLDIPDALASEFLAVDLASRQVSAE
jgi:hypothetical protein